MTLVTRVALIIVLCVGLLATTVEAACVDTACTSCTTGTFGATCSSTCTCSSNGVCSQGPTGTGYCTSCSTGYYGRNCDARSVDTELIEQFEMIGLQVVMVLWGYAMAATFYAYHSSHGLGQKSTDPAKTDEQQPPREAQGAGEGGAQAQNQQQPDAAEGGAAQQVEDPNNAEGQQVASEGEEDEEDEEEEERADAGVAGVGETQRAAGKVGSDPSALSSSGQESRVVQPESASGTSAHGDATPPAAQPAAQPAASSNTSEAFGAPGSKPPPKIGKKKSSKKLVRVDDEGRPVTPPPPPGRAKANESQPNEKQNEAANRAVSPSDPVRHHRGSSIPLSQGVPRNTTTAGRFGFQRSMSANPGAGDLSHAALASGKNPEPPTLRATGKSTIGQAAVPPPAGHEHAHRRQLPPTRSMSMNERDPSEFRASSVAGGGAYGGRSMSVPSSQFPSSHANQYPHEYHYGSTPSMGATPMHYQPQSQSQFARSSSAAPYGYGQSTPMAYPPSVHPGYAPYQQHSQSQPQAPPQSDGSEVAYVIHRNGAVYAANMMGPVGAPSGRDAESLQPQRHTATPPQQPHHAAAVSATPRASTPVQQTFSRQSESPAQPSVARGPVSSTAERLSEPVARNSSPPRSDSVRGSEEGRNQANRGQSGRASPSMGRAKGSAVKNEKAGPKFMEGDSIRRNHFRPEIQCNFGGAVQQLFCGERAVVSRCVTHFVEDPIEGRVARHYYYVEGGDVAPDVDMEPLFVYEGNVLGSRSASVEPQPLLDPGHRSSSHVRQQREYDNDDDGYDEDAPSLGRRVSFTEPRKPANDSRPASTGPPPATRPPTAATDSNGVSPPATAR